MDLLAETTKNCRRTRCAGCTQRCGRARSGLAIATLAALTLCGCNSAALRNGWLSPTHLGNFEEFKTSEIRTSLTLDDTPTGILGATLPVPGDLIVEAIEPEISPGDTIAIEIFELRQPFVPYQAQISVTATGYVNLPVIGRVYAIGHTAEGLEKAIAKTLRDRDILIDPEVTVNPVFVQRATYSIFGVGVSASNNAPLRAGTFPIRRPGLRILEAINQVGGLNEFVEDIYVFRYDEADNAALRVPGRDRSGDASPGGSSDTALANRSAQRGVARNAASAQTGEGAFLSPEDELIAVVLQPEARSAARSRPSVEPVPAEPNSVDPYIWVGDEFVPNPNYQRSSAEANRPTRPQDGAFAPMVDWDRIAGDVAYRIMRIPADMLRAGDPQVNVVIRPGDVIRIVSGQIGVFYVMGQVNRVGSFSFNAEPVTLKSAIAMAGGLAGLAWPSRCTVYRRLGRREQMIQVDLDRIFAGKDADFLVKRGDIINVGTHPLAPFLQRLRALTLPNPVSTLGYSFTYSRSFSFATIKNEFR